MQNQLSVVREINGLVFETGYKVLERKGLAIIWMSIGNSYFSPERIKDILSFCNGKFGKIKVLIPFGPARYTYEAMGYNSNKASSKARLNSNRLKNHTKRILANKNLKSLDCTIIDWENEIELNNDYQINLEEIKYLYSNDLAFNEECNIVTLQVLKGKITNGCIETAIKIGVKYLLEELAFVLASPMIFNIENTAYLYHKNWPIFENLVNGLYNRDKEFRAGFILVN